MKALLCCIARLENQYIREYVDYYKELGVTNICLYDNNYDGEEDFNDVIGDYINDGFVILKDYRNKKICQLDAYNDCYNSYNEEYDWIMFFDCDEFLTLTKHSDVSEFLTKSCFQNFDMIHLNWMMYDDNGMVNNSNLPLFERFKTPMMYDKCVAYEFPENFHIKSIIRGGLKDIKWVASPHTPVNKNYTCCNDVGSEVVSYYPFSKISFEDAYIKHFNTKTIEEYCLKMKRGFPDQEINLEKIKICLDRVFFRINEITKEKIDVVKKMLGIDMEYLLSDNSVIEKNDDIKIFSLCYDKKEFKFLNDSVITPLQVGASNGKDVCKLKDNTGDNISERNFFYIENTGTYWIWKNVNGCKYKGQMQYRRPLDGVNESMNFDDVFSKYKVITCEPFNHPANSKPTEKNPMFIPAQTVEQGYAFSNCIDDLYMIEMVINIFYPEYKDSYVKYIKNGENLYYSNGFIMKAEDYDRYCSFLFDCLEKYQTFIDVSTPEKLRNKVLYNMKIGKYPKHMNSQTITEDAIRWQMSIGGFLSERIWTLWLLHNFKEEEILKLPYNKMEENMYT